MDIPGLTLALADGPSFSEPRNGPAMADHRDPPAAVLRGSVLGIRRHRQSRFSKAEFRAMAVRLNGAAVLS